MGFNSAPIFVKVCLFLLLGGFVLHLIGFATSYWVKYTVDTRMLSRTFGSYGRGAAVFRGKITTHTGLWSNCVEYEGHSEQCYDTSGGASWFEATQAFETLGFIAALASLVLIILYIFVPATSGKKIVFILTLLACFAAAGCIILGIIIYGSKVKDNLSWSFALCTIAGIIFGVSGILLIIDMLKK